MNATRRISSFALSVLVSSSLVAAPVAAQDDFGLPEGDFELPEGDFEDMAAAPEETTPPADDTPKTTPAPAAPAQTDVVGTEESASSPGNTRSSSPDGTTPAKDDVLPSGADKREHNDKRKAPVPSSTRPLERVPLTQTDAVELDAEQPPETEGDATMFWVTTGVGTALGVAVLAGLGVGGAILFGPDFGPKGSITVTPY